MSVWTAIASGLAILAGALKPSTKKFNLWYWDRDKWVKMGGPFSERQCKKLRKELLRAGLQEWLFLILRDGVKPPVGGRPV